MPGGGNHSSRYPGCLEPQSNPQAPAGHGRAAAVVRGRCHSLQGEVLLLLTSLQSLSPYSTYCWCAGTATMPQDLGETGTSLAGRTGDSGLRLHSSIAWMIGRQPRGESSQSELGQETGSTLPASLRVCPHCHVSVGWGKAPRQLPAVLLPPSQTKEVALLFLLPSNSRLRKRVKGPCCSCVVPASHPTSN